MVPFCMLSFYPWHEFTPFTYGLKKFRCLWGKFYSTCKKHLGNLNRKWGSRWAKKVWNYYHQRTLIKVSPSTRPTNFKCSSSSGKTLGILQWLKTSAEKPSWNIDNGKNKKTENGNFMNHSQCAKRILNKITKNHQKYLYRNKVERGSD